jgi:hypothetical protein
MKKTLQLSSFYLMLVLTLAGCAAGGPIQYSASTSQPLDRVRTVGVGDVVLKVEVKKNLPNAFGQADVFGRTTPAGLITVVYEGLDNGNITLVRTDIDINSGATTMNSTPLYVPNTSTTRHTGTLGGTSYYGTSVTSGSTVVLPNTPTATYSNRGGKIIKVGKNNLPSNIHVDDFIIELSTATETMLEYTIRSKKVK